MILLNDIKNAFKDLEIIKPFQKTGQKQVYLVKYQNNDYVLKIFNNNDLRVRREIDIIQNNNIHNVPKIIKKNEININGNSYGFIIEEYVEGETLDLILKKRKLNLNETLKLLETLLIICVHLENIKVVHRDIKPGNIIFGNDKEFYLIDFGIARQLNEQSLTVTDVQVGPHTPGYGAPELFLYSKKDIDIRADLFSIGVVIFEAISGKHPFISGDEDHFNQIWKKTIMIVPKPFLINGDLDKQLISFIEVLMEKHIPRRPKNAEQALNWFYAVRATLDLEEE